MLKTITLTAWLAAFGGDAATTHVALHQGVGREWLIPAQNPVIIDGVLAAQAVGGWLALNRLQKTHPKLATTLRWTIIGIHGAAAVHNYHIIR